MNGKEIGNGRGNYQRSPRVGTNGTALSQRPSPVSPEKRRRGLALPGGYSSIKCYGICGRILGGNRAARTMR
jgi:hypothetical protein